VRALFSKLLRLAWPVALARLGIMGMGVVDVMVVGQMVPEELPYQALGWAPIGVLMVTGIGLLTGVQVLAARGAWRRGLVVAAAAGALAVAVVWLLGARAFTAFGIAPELAVPASRVASILVLSVPLHFFYVVTAFFLESIQRPLASTIVMWSANAANLVLNLALVPSFGAVGSAWSTVGARFCLAFGVRERAAGPSYKSLLGVGSAAALSHAAESGAFSGMTLLAGRLGATAVSGYQILLNLLSIVFMISLGVSSATAVLTSEATGRRAATDASRASFGGLALNTLCMLVAATFVLAFADSIGRAYTANLTLAAFVSSVLWLAAVVMLPDGGQVVVAAALRARGDNWFPTVSHLLAYALVMPALAYWLAEARGQGVTGLMLAIFGASVLSCGVLCLRLWHLHRQAFRLPIG
jgi:MATE family multidrug resistance protein